jgi:hypothetical protein
MQLQFFLDVLNELQHRVSFVRTATLREFGDNDRFELPRIGATATQES